MCVGIIGAMDVEIDSLKKKIDNLTEEKYGFFTFFCRKNNE